MVRFVLRRGQFCPETWSVSSGPFCPWSVLSKYHLFGDPFHVGYWKLPYPVTINSKTLRSLSIFQESAEGPSSNQVPWTRQPWAQSAKRTYGQNLGVTIINDLKWDCHIHNNIFDTASRIIWLSLKKPEYWIYGLQVASILSLVRLLVKFSSTVWDAHT